MRAVLHPPIAPTGRIRSLDAFRPKDELSRPLHELPDGDWMMRISFVDTGEKAEYRLTDTDDDPGGR